MPVGSVYLSPSFGRQWFVFYVPAAARILLPGPARALSVLFGERCPYGPRVLCSPTVGYKLELFAALPHMDFYYITLCHFTCPFSSLPARRPTGPPPPGGGGEIYGARG